MNRVSNVVLSNEAKEAVTMKRFLILRKGNTNSVHTEDWIASGVKLNCGRVVVEELFPVFTISTYDSIEYVKVAYDTGGINYLCWIDI